MCSSAYGIRSSRQSRSHRISTSSLLQVMANPHSYNFTVHTYEASVTVIHNDGSIRSPIAIPGGHLYVPPIVQGQNPPTRPTYTGISISISGSFTVQPSPPNPPIVPYSPPRASNLPYAPRSNNLVSAPGRHEPREDTVKSQDRDQVGMSGLWGKAKEKHVRNDGMDLDSSERNLKMIDRNMEKEQRSRKAHDRDRDEIKGRQYEGAQRTNDSTSFLRSRRYRLTLS